MADKKTSIRETLIKITEEGIFVPDIQEAVVVKANPLTIRLVNEKKITLTSDDLVIPERMTNHKVTISSGDVERTVEVKSALKKGEKVNLLQYSDGKLYYILDRV